MWSAQDILVVRAAVEGGGKLFAGDGIVWAEFAFAVACKDVVLCAYHFPASTSVKLPLPFDAGLPSMRQRIVAIMPRVAVSCGRNRVLLVPRISPFS